MDIQEDVLIVSRHYAPEPTGSAPVIQQMAEWLASDGMAVEVVTVRPNYPGSQIFPGFERGQRDVAVENGVSIRRLPTRPSKGPRLLARAGPEALFMVQLLFHRMRRRPSSRLVTLCPSILTVLGALPLRARGGRHITVLHDVQSGLGTALGVGRLVAGILRRLEAWTLNRVDHLVVLSDAMGRAIADMGVRTPYVVAPPQVDTRVIRPLPEAEGRPTLMYSGNLGRKQGLHVLLQLAAILKFKAPDIRILVRGDGALRSELVEGAEAQGLSNFEVEPLVAREDLPRSLSEGHVHLVPQLPGGRDFAVPSKIFSIMAAGRPFLATADEDSHIFTLAENVGAGLAISTSDVEGLADAAIALLRDAPRRRRMGEAGRSWVEKEADTAVVMRRIAGLLRA